MKKLLSFVLAVLFIFSSAYICVPYAEEEKDIKLYFESEKITSEKSTVTLKVDLLKNVSVNGIVLGVGYNNEVFSVSNIESENWQILSNIYTESDSENPENRVETGYFKIVFDDTSSGITQNTELLSFDVIYSESLPAGNYEFKLQEIEIYDSNLNNLNYETNSLVYINAAAVNAELTVSPFEKELALNETVKLNATITPNNYYYETLTWTSNMPTVAEVSADGTVKAVGYGTATVTAKTNTGVVGSCDITVTDLIPTNVTIEKMPLKLNYSVGEYFDDTGMELKVIYNNGTSRTVKDGWTYNKTLPLTASDRTVLINYRNCTTELEISINSNTSSGRFSKIEVGSLPKTTYILKVESPLNFTKENAESLAAKTVFDFSGLAVSVTDNYGNVTDNYAYYESGLLDISYSKAHIGYNTVSVTFDGLTTTFDIFIDVTMLTVTGVGKTEFFGTGSPDFSGFSAQFDSIYFCLYNTNSSVNYEPMELTSSNFAFNYNNLSLGENSVTAVFNYFGTSFEYNFIIKINELKKEDIKIISLPTKTVFPLGETVDFSGLKVAVVYNNKNEVLLNESDYNLQYDQLTEGENTIKILYENFEKEFNITLLSVPYISVFAQDDTAKPCVNYKIPVGIKSGNNSDISFSKLEIEIVFDPLKLEFSNNSVVFENSELNNAEIKQSNNKITVAYYGESITAKSNENLLVLSFKAYGNTENTTVPVEVKINKICYTNTKDTEEAYTEFPLKESEKTVTVSVLSHDKVESLKQATLKNDGYIKTVCKNCAKELKEETLLKPFEIVLSATEVTYNGKTRTPTVSVKTKSGKALENKKDYTVTYASGRKTVGKYKVTVTFKGNYTGKKELYFKIVPAKRGITKVTAGKKKATVKWKTQTTQTSGYQIQYSTNSKFKTYKTVTVSGNKATTKTVKNLTSKKTYYFRLRTYKTVNGEKIVSGWSTAKKVKIK